ncbi:MAG: RHS repeat protein [Nitrospira sp.]|nr:RHS repeat protein [Nitrospira sp.]
MQFDKVGNVVSSTDPLGRVTTYRYDTAHRALGMVDALGNEIEHDLDPQEMPSDRFAARRPPTAKRLKSSRPHPSTRLVARSNSVIRSTTQPRSPGTPAAACVA